LDVSEAAGPVLMTNHFFNDQIFRILEHRSDRNCVTGPDSFSHVGLCFDRLQERSRLFAKSWRVYVEFIKYAVQGKRPFLSAIYRMLWTTWRFMRL
jgi:hypothetical protein